MSKEGCEEYGDFYYCLRGGKYILGDNSSSSANALITNHVCPEKIIVPVYVNGHKIEEIGSHALQGCNKIRILVIKARITQINEYAFYEGTSLREVYLPNTLINIMAHSIHVWNRTLGSGVVNPGVTEIFFEKNSKLAFINDQGISYRENMILYTCTAINPKLHTYAFNIVSRLTIISPMVFSIKGSYSVQSSLYNCGMRDGKTCDAQRRQSSSWYCVLIVILSN